MDAQHSSIPITKIWFSFKGRIPRSTFWVKCLLPYYASVVVVVLLGTVIGNLASSASGAGLGEILVSLVLALVLLIAELALMIGGFWVFLAASIKRSHDRGRSGWFALLFYIPIINIWPFIELGFLAGTEGENRFGPDSRAQLAASTTPL